MSMRARAEHRWVGVVVGYVLLAGLVLLATVPAYVFVAPASRALVVRLAAALVVGVALLHLRALLARRIENQGASAFDSALRPPPAEPGRAGRLVELDEQLRASLGSARYFELVMWPRLSALASRPPARPAGRWWRRGPSLDGLRRAVAVIEEGP